MNDSSTTPAGSAAASGAGSPAGIAGQARALWTKLPARARVAALASTLAIVGLVAYLVLHGGSAAWAKVVPGLTPTDATELIAVLNDREIPSRLRPGSVVEVPAAKLAEARAAAVVAGVPRSQAGLESLNKTVFGMSSEQERIRYQTALMGDLAHKIETLGPISGAKVSLQLGARSVFKDSAQPATASVQVRIRPGETLSSQQVLGIKQSVAAAVTGLDVEHVYVMDQNANPLSSDDQRAGDAQLALERRLADDVRKMLENVTGAGKVKAVVQVELDHRTINKTEEVFAQPVPLSSVKTVVGAPGAPVTSGVTGVQGNLPGTPPATTTVTAAGPTTTSETINNQIPRTITQTAEPGMGIARIHLAVLVDDKLDADGELVAWTDDEIKNLRGLAHTAAGLRDDRGDELTLQSMPFAPVDEPAPPVVASKPARLPVPLPYAAAAGGLLVIVIAFLVLRRRRAPVAELTTAHIALPAPVSELERALSPPALGGGPVPDAPQLPSGRSLEERVVGAVRADVTRASRVLASWLHEPDPAPTSHAKAARS
jgi:flagellar M-ring protein FliF